MKTLIIAIALLMAGCSTDEIRNATLSDLNLMLEQNHQQRRELRDEIHAMVIEEAKMLHEAGKTSEAIDVLRKNMPPLVTEQALRKILEGKGALVGF
jgi:glutamyl-tRNA reductase